MQNLFAANPTSTNKLYSTRLLHLLNKTQKNTIFSIHPTELPPAHNHCINFSLLRSVNTWQTVIMINNSYLIKYGNSLALKLIYN